MTLLFYRLLWWLRNHGLGWFGFVDVKFIGHCQIILRWGLGIPTRYEVWYHGLFGLTEETADEHYEPLSPGSPERYHRLNLSADRIYAGNDVNVAEAEAIRKNACAKRVLKKTHRRKKSRTMGELK